MGRKHPVAEMAGIGLSVGLRSGPCQMMCGYCYIPGVTLVGGDVG